MNKPKSPPVTASWEPCYNCDGTGKELETIRCYDDYECHMPYRHVIKRKGSKCDNCKGEKFLLNQQAWHATKPYYRELWRQQHEAFKKAMFGTLGQGGFLSRFFEEGLDSEMAYRRETIMETI